MVCHSHQVQNFWVDRLILKNLALVLLLNLIDFLYSYILHVSAHSGKDPNGVGSFLVELERQLSNKHKLR